MKKCDIILFFKQVFPEKLKSILVLTFPFLLMDIFIRMLASRVNYNLDSIPFPSSFFSVMWIVLVVAVTMCLKNKAGRIFYGIAFGLFFFLFATHSVYFPYTGFFFSFNLLQSAQEGSAYIWSTLREAGLYTWFTCLAVLAGGVFAMFKFPDHKKNHWITMSGFFALFIILHTVNPTFLGKANSSLAWDTWRNPRNIYENFSDSNKNIKICGFYEYSVRDFYVTFLKAKDKIDPEEMSFLEEMYDTKTPHVQNQYTGLFEGKNVIFLQLEGIDSWLLNETDMPTLYSMRNNSFVFDNHYSYYNGGGSTFNSELAVTTGLLTPVSYNRNPYSFNKNYFPDTLPKLFKEKGYTANAFHMNTGEYYMRELNYLNWGYDNYYSLMDDGGYEDGNLSFHLDSELVQNKVFYDKLFKQDKPFMHYIITYTPHTPFSLESRTGRLLSEKQFGKDADIPFMSEEETARFFAGETDNMIKLLLEGLEANGLIDDTVIVAFADHYLYTLNDKTVLDEYKITSNNLINRTPFLIWSNNMNDRYVEKVNSQLDILPTVLNLFGIKYTEEYYIGKDVLDVDYNGYVFFSDYSWYDGINYVEFGESVNNPDANKEYINETNTSINALIRKNDLTLKYDYFRKMADKR